ncbi:hypothetical protein BD410DRAFT_810733, partial [Rickenella mellea]
LSLRGTEWNKQGHRLLDVGESSDDENDENDEEATAQDDAPHKKEMTRKQFMERALEMDSILQHVNDYVLVSHPLPGILSTLADDRRSYNHGNTSAAVRTHNVHSRNFVTQHSVGCFQYPIRTAGGLCASLKVLTGKLVLFICEVPPTLTGQAYMNIHNASASHQWRKFAPISNGWYTQILECGDIIIIPPCVLYGWVILEPTIMSGHHFHTYDTMRLTEIARRLDHLNPGFVEVLHEGISGVISAMALNYDKDLENDDGIPILPSLQRMTILSHLYEIPDDENHRGILQPSAALVDKCVEEMFTPLEPSLPLFIDKMEYRLLRRARWVMTALLTKDQKAMKSSMPPEITSLPPSFRATKLLDVEGFFWDFARSPKINAKRKASSDGKSKAKKMAKTTSSTKGGRAEADVGDDRRAQAGGGSRRGGGGRGRATGGKGRGRGGK